MCAAVPASLPGNPFLSDLAPEVLMGLGNSVVLHPDALEELEQLVAIAEAGGPEAAGRGGGQVVLLKAPRAGYGKSHLLARLAGGASLEGAWVIPLRYDPESGVSWRLTLRQVLEWVHETTSAEGLGMLDLIVRRVFSRMNADLVRTGKVSCSQPAATVAALNRDFAGMFDFGNNSQPVARWFQDNFETLLPASLSYLQTVTALRQPQLYQWLRAFCGYAQGGAERDPRRLETLRWSLRQPVSTAAGGGGIQLLSAVTEDEVFHRDQLAAFCRLAAMGRPVVILMDHLDGFYNSPEGILRLGRLISDWRQLAGRTVLLLSVNEDLWSGIFQKSLPSALEDRLTGWEVNLKGIRLEEAEALVGSRLREAGVSASDSARFEAELNLAAFIQDRDGLGISPRMVLRQAARCWVDFQKAGTKPSVSKIAEIPELTALRPCRVEPPPLSLENKEGPPESLIPAQPEAAVSPIPIPVLPRLPPLVRAPTPPRPFTEEKCESGWEHRPATTTHKSENSLAARFQRLRAYFLSLPDLPLDHDRLHRLVKWSGQRLAVVRYAESAIPSLPGSRVSVWHSPDEEILFGTEPHGDRNYWAVLIEFAQRRYDQMPGCRLVLFSAAAAPLNLSRWLAQDEIVAARACFLDVQTLSAAELATLHATDEVLREAERGALMVGSGDAFAAMAPHLDFFWKRLTRPIGSRSG